MNYQEPTECTLCGEQGRGIAYQLVRWADALPGMQYAHIPRCDDRAACRARVEASGERWPIHEEQAA